MRLRLWSAAAGLGALLLAGCATRSVPASNAKAPAAKPVPRSSAETQDYSSSAVDARTEAHARYTAGVLAELDDDPQAAADNYFKAAVAEPANESLVLEAAGKLLRQKRTDQAIEVLKKSASRSQASADVLARLGLAYSVAGKKELAIEASRSAIRKDPANFDGYQYLAQLHLQADQRVEGLKVLDEAARQTKVDADFLIDLGEAYLTFSRGAKVDEIKPKAMDAFRRAAAFNVTSPALLQRLGDGFSQLGESELAIQHYNRLLARVPRLPFVRDRLIELYLRRHDHTNAAEHLRAVLQDSPANPQAHYLLGSIYLEQKKLAEAEDSFNKAILLNPDFEPAYYDLAVALLSGDKPRRALEILEKAQGKFRQSFACEYYSALAYTRLKDFTAALKRFTAAEVIAGASTNRLTDTFYFQIGSAYERTHNIPDAEKYFRKALDLSPEFAEALNYLGYMWAERGERLEEARGMIEKAVKLEPKNAAFLDSLGWVLFKQNKPDEALPWIQKSIEYSEDPDATLYDHLGDIYQRLNEPDKAREAWQKSIQIEASPAVEKKLKGQTSKP